MNTARATSIQSVWYRHYNRGRY